MADEFGIDGDPAARVLTEDPVEADNGDETACQQFAQHSAGADRGKLVCVTDQDELAAARHCLEKMQGKMVIQHGDLVGEDQIGLQRFHTAEVSAVKGE